MILLTGATGYVGGRLLQRLEEDGLPVRCMSRHPEALERRVKEGTELIGGDLLDQESLEKALQGVHHAYYLAHSMGEGEDFEAREAQAARNFVEAAAAAGVERIIYLGGLAHDDEEDLSPHLRSRHNVGRILREGKVPAIEFRASIIIGSGSISFELIRALVQRLPVMITPKWVSVPAQPIAITDVISYLRAAIDVPLEQSALYEIGGADVVTYGDLMREVGRQRGLRRYMIPVPFLSPGLSSLWLHLVTPVHVSVGRKLIAGIQSPSIVRDDSALRDFDLRPMNVSEAIEQALANEDQEVAATYWVNALYDLAPQKSFGGVSFRNRIADARTPKTSAPPEVAFAAIQRIGGANGWYYANYLWSIRGFIDILAGGVGLRRGRAHPTKLHPGDVVDWWRVERFEPDKRLVLYAEMRVPGRAWLEFLVEPEGEGSCIHQTALFDPVGIFGISYWYGLYVLHQFVFAGMLRNIARAAEEDWHKQQAEQG